MWYVIIILIITIILSLGMFGAFDSKPYTNESWNDQMEKDYDEEKWKAYYDKYEKHKK